VKIRPDGEKLRQGLDPWPAVDERLYSRITLPAPPNGCMLWTGAVSGAGYGIMRVAGRMQYVHRLVHEKFLGPIPEGYQIDHLCRVRRCVCPAHLEAVPQAENIRRDWHRRWDVRDGVR
jgi:hypothetical protein